MEERIRQAKTALGSRAVILGHHYQRDEVVKFADFRGDSLKLSRLAANRKEAEYHCFLRRPFHGGECGHSAGRAPSGRSAGLNAGCSMADMADIDQVEVCWEEVSQLSSGSIVPVTYINSTAAIKAFVGRQRGRGLHFFQRAKSHGLGSQARRERFIHSR